MKMTSHLFYLAWMLWLCWGALQHNRIDAEWMVGKWPDRSLVGKEITVGGQMLLGLESGTLYELGTSRADMGGKDGIHLEFDDWMEKEFNRLPIQGFGLVRGVLEADAFSQYGSMGTHEMRLTAPTVIRWPSPLFEITFVAVYGVAPLFVLLLLRRLILPRLK